MTARKLAALTGERRAGRILNHLSRNNFFTNRYELPEPVFQYHPLFREFLLARARDRFSPVQLADLRRRAATILEAEGQADEAVPLLRAARDWQGLARLAVRRAPALLAQARDSTLEDWLTAVPEALAQRDPWIQYWLGTCFLTHDLAKSLRHFTHAFESFRARRDPEGSYLAWAGAVTAIQFEWGDFRRLDRWIALHADLARDHPVAPSHEVEARVASSMFSALMLRQPYQPDIAVWAGRALALAGGDAPPSLRLLTGFHLTLYELWLGDIPRAARASELLRDAARRLEPSPMAQLLWTLAAAALEWHRADADGCRRLVEGGLAAARTTGVHLWDYQILAQGVYGAMTSGDVAWAESLLREMGSVQEGTRSLDAAQYHFLSAWAALQRRDLPRAHAHADTAVRLTAEVGTPFPEALNRLALAQVQHERGESRAAASHLAHARRIGRRMGSEMVRYLGALVEADIAFGRGRERQGLRALRQAMAVGRERGLVNTPWWRADMLARLCARALDAGIEVDHVRDLIRRRRLLPAEPPLGDRWPWPVRVTTLGRFAVAVDDGTLRPLTSGKSQRRPLDLLKALVALGGQDVPEDRLAEALWPDAHGDDAHQAFSTTLHRLRRLLGDDQAIAVRGGHASLDRRRVWVDALAFEDLIARAESEGRAGREGVGPALAEQALALYRGAFLADDADRPWAASARERLRRKFLRHAVLLARRQEHAGRWSEAIDWYERGLDVDDLAEELYQGLMACHQALGNRAHAAAAYERCRRALAAGLGVTPSGRTEALRRAIHGAAATPEPPGSAVAGAGRVRPAAAP
jgi:DNA-binding SARP family transcriptional activator